MKSLIIEIKKEVWSKTYSARELRHFGRVVGGIFLAIALFFYYRDPSTWEFVLGGLGSVLILSSLFSHILQGPYKAWIALSFILGAIMSTLILTILFYTVITPIALVKRVFSFKRKKKIETYWHPHTDTDWKQSMEEMS